MSDCKMQYAEHNGTYVLKLRGDVRVPICTSLEKFIEDHLLNDKRLRAVMIDLTETDSIDSTALGLLAKIAVALRELNLGKPIILCLSSDINRILASMGFDEVFRILQTTAALRDRLDELPDEVLSEAEVTQCVIDAHRTLMGLSESNQQTFRSLVDALESEKRHQH
ncbi:MAG: STAS domain-containing protein [Moraxellaceae bacterium]|nr:STAS domain-containing protein [Moraxellaceae bacterium]